MLESKHLINSPSLVDYYGIPVAINKLEQSVIFLDPVKPGSIASVILVTAPKKPFEETEGSTYGAKVINFLQDNLNNAETIGTVVWNDFLDSSDWYDLVKTYPPEDSNAS